MYINQYPVALNHEYTLNNKRVKALTDSLYQCMNNPQWDMGVLAVRMDFTIPKGRSIIEDIPSVDTYGCFDNFLNRIRRVLVDGQIINCVVNWKREFSTKKGKHIHTVWYFNRRQFPEFAANLKLFNTIRNVWERCSDNPALDNVGTINIVESYLSESTEYYRAKPFPNGNERFQKPHYYTILTNNPMIYAGLEEFHQQKHLFDKPCGFMHWVSYLAKTEQQAPVRKSFGIINN